MNLYPKLEINRDEVREIEGLNQNGEVLRSLGLDFTKRQINFNYA
jgi:hypothetical protein